MTGARYIIQIVVQLILTVSVLLGSAVVGLAWYLVRRVTTPRRPRRPLHYTFTPWEFGIAYRTVRIRHRTDELDAWFLPQPETAAPCILILPGHGGNKSELLGIASALHRDGFACLLLDFRGAGKSTGDMITLGHHETEDVITAVDWLSTEVRPVSIGALGFSLGGSVAINAAAIDDRIEAVVSDSAFASQYDILAHQVRRATRLWPAPILAVAQPMFRRRHQRSYTEFSPVDRIHEISPRAILLIHPDDDHMVPLCQGLQLWEQAREPKELWVAQGVGHCGAYFDDREYYCRRVSEFFTCTVAST